MTQYEMTQNEIDFLTLEKRNDDSSTIDNSINYLKDFLQNMTIEEAQEEAVGDMTTTLIRKNLEIKDYDNCETLMLGSMPIACRSETEITKEDGDYETIRDGLYIFYPKIWFMITNCCYRDELLAQKFNDLMTILLCGNISVFGGV